MARQHSPNMPEATHSLQHHSFVEEQETPNPLPSHDYSHGESADEQDELEDGDSDPDA